MRLDVFAAELAPTVSSWATDAEDVRRWCSRDQAPVPPEDIVGWGWADGVRQFSLSRDGEPIGYGELWVDDDEAEVELARLIVAPGHRGRGVGRALVAQLVTKALLSYPDVFMRVHPDNEAALRCYAGAGFVSVAADEQATFNKDQPVPYVWLKYTT